MMHKTILYFSLAIIAASFCSKPADAQVSKKAVNEFLNDSAVRTGHAGISIYDPASKKYLYNYNADKNFLPSSNVKLFTLYAGLKYLGDSIPGMHIEEFDSSIYLSPAGDPTLLHPDFFSQPVIDYLSATNKHISIRMSFIRPPAFAPGWTWEDYSEDFMPERSAMPVYGNLITFSGTESNVSYFPKAIMPSQIEFPFFGDDSIAPYISGGRRQRDKNVFGLKTRGTVATNISIPFIVSESLVIKLLSDTIHKDIRNLISEIRRDHSTGTYKTVHSRPVDSLFRPMMFNSDNFFAEQTLLMVSNERLGYMNDEAIIDTLLKTDLADIPTKPRWVDGSGLSRYDLFSPKDFIYILVKLQNEFGWERMKRILPGAGEGTLKHYYEDVPGRIYAKTGSMSNNVSLSGYLITKKNKKLLFSVIINNFSGSGTSGRKAIEKLILSVIESN